MKNRRSRYTLMSLRKAMALAAFFMPLFLVAQDTAKFVVQENFKREIVIDNKRYRVYNNWVTFGGGGTWHSENPRTQLNVSMNYFFHIKQPYFGLGGIVSGDEFGLWNNFSAHAGYVPWRKETERKNMAAFAALSYTLGYDFLYAGTYSSNRWDRVGFYAEFQYTMKLQYAVGVGPTFFVDVNQKRTLVGIRIDGYLSGAYRGYVKGKQPPPKIMN
jgi:hypothetical protein